MRIGDKVTFASEIISVGGRIDFDKGQHATVSDIIYAGGIWGKSGTYYPKRISGVKIAESNGVIWKPDTFIELKGETK